jgi:hypothetical protein
VTIISRPRVGEEKRASAAWPQLGTRVGPKGDFFIFFARNPLKSPDSEKLLKENESNFPFICFHKFAFSFL